MQKIRKRWCLPGISLAILLLLFSTLAGTGCSGCKSDPDQPGEKPQFSPPRVGEPALDFSLPDLQGRTVSLKDFAGQAVLLYFWTTRCPYCVEGMPLLENAHFDNDRVEIVMVNVSEEEGTVGTFMAQQGFTFPVLLDQSGSLFRGYGFPGYPSTVIINQEGMITATRIGAIDETILQQLLDTIP